MDNDLRSQTGKTDAEVTKKRDRVLRKWLGIKQQFRNPLGATATRDAVDESLKGDH